METSKLESDVMDVVESARQELVKLIELKQQEEDRAI